MKVKMLVEDRDLAYLFMDVNDSPEDSRLYELVLEGVCLEQSMDESQTLWLEHRSESTLRVIKDTLPNYVENSDFATDSDPEWMPIPTPVLCLNKNCMSCQD